MSNEEKIKNIIAFLSIVFDEKTECLQAMMNLSPEYLWEKFNRYVLSPHVESNWGLHPFLRRRIFDRYCDKWGLKKTDETF